jgi:hypothetical protein
MPIWSDACELQTLIDRAVTRWSDGSPMVDAPTTPDRPRWFAGGRFRPQDSRMLTDRAAEVKSWVVSIVKLLDPEHVKEACALPDGL